MKKTLCFLTIIFMLTLTACQNNEIAQTEVEEGYPVVAENYGREVEINQKPQKVLTLGPNCTELFVALGLEDYVVGKSLVNHSRGPLPEYAEGVNKIPQLNYGSATREAVISSGADFIYAIDWEISDQGVNIEEAQTMGMNVYVNSATTIEEQYKEILDIGMIFGIEDKASEIVENTKGIINEIHEKTKDASPVKVLVYDSGNNGVFTCSGSNFENELIEKAGGKNIFSDITDKQWITVGYEDILKRDPDIIIIHDYDSPSADEKIAEIKANPSLSQLECVKNERFVTVTLESVLPGIRISKTITDFATAFHPEIFKK